MPYRTEASKPKRRTARPLTTEAFVAICKRYAVAQEQAFEAYHQSGTIRVPEHCRDSFEASGSIVDGKRLYGFTRPG